MHRGGLGHWSRTGVMRLPDQGPQGGSSTASPEAGGSSPLTPDSAFSAVLKLPGLRSVVTAALTHGGKEDLGRGQRWRGAQVTGEGDEKWPDSAGGAALEERPGVWRAQWDTSYSPMGQRRERAGERSVRET